MKSMLNETARANESLPGLGGPWQPLKTFVVYACVLTHEMALTSDSRVTHESRESARVLLYHEQGPPELAKDYVCV